MLRSSHRLCFVLTLSVLLTACQAPPAPSTAPPTAPEILARSTKAGKGVPNGRSDTQAPYLRMPLLISQDPGYGFSKEKPIKVGPRSRTNLHILFLNALRGPQGQPLEYERQGACCEFPSVHTPMGIGLLDVYRIRVDGTDQDRLIYVDMYEPGPPQIPMGFTLRSALSS
jgi:hypothetical protein